MAVKDIHTDWHGVTTASFDSSAIKCASYTRTGFLFVEFTSGKIYKYSDVFPWEYDGLLEADSTGKYFNEIIKPYHVVEDAA